MKNYAKNYQESKYVTVDCKKIKRQRLLCPSIYYLHYHSTILKMFSFDT